MNKKILGSGVAVVAAVGLLAGGTFAAFSDYDVVENNTLAAGTLEIDLSDVKGEGKLPFTVSNMKPGDKKSVAVKVTNDGSIDANASLWFTQLETAGNANTALAEQLKITVTNDRRAGLNLGCRTLLGTNPSERFTSVLAGIGDETKVDLLRAGLSQAVVGPLGPNQFSCVFIEAEFIDHDDAPTGAYAENVNNDAQGGEVAFDLVFRLDQA